LDRRRPRGAPRGELLRLEGAAPALPRPSHARRRPERRRSRPGAFHLQHQGVSEAVAAIQTGDIPALERALDADPGLLHRRLTGYGDHGDYFRDPKLLWFVAGNPNLIEVMPANSVELTRALLARGPAQEDLDYTLGLVMTSQPAREQGLQLPLMDALIEAGAA